MAASPKKAKPATTNDGTSRSGGVVEISERSVRAIADAVSEKLMDIGPKLARLAAADTIHSVERPKTVLSRAIAEGVSARALLLSLGELDTGEA